MRWRCGGRLRKRFLRPRFVPTGARQKSSSSRRLNLNLRVRSNGFFSGRPKIGYNTLKRALPGNLDADTPDARDYPVASGLE